MKVRSVAFRARPLRSIPSCGSSTRAVAAASASSGPSTQPLPPRICRRPCPRSCPRTCRRQPAALGTEVASYGLGLPDGGGHHASHAARNAGGDCRAGTEVTRASKRSSAGARKTGSEDGPKEEGASDRALGARSRDLDQSCGPQQRLNRYASCGTTPKARLHKSSRPSWLQRDRGRRPRFTHEPCAGQMLPSPRLAAPWIGTTERLEAPIWVLAVGTSVVRVVCHPSQEWTAPVCRMGPPPA